MSISAHLRPVALRPRTGARDVIGPARSPDHPAEHDAHGTACATAAMRAQARLVRYGHVDGAWWPRSLNLHTELPALRGMLAVRAGQPQWVAYDVAGWDPAPRRIHVDGHIVRLGGFRCQAPHTLDVRSHRRHTRLLVVPPETTTVIARQALLRASQSGNRDSVHELLAPTGGPTATMPVPGDSTDAATQR